VTGGPVALAMSDSADASAWYNACSAAGAKEWPYGNSFDGGCNGSYFSTTSTTAGPKSLGRSGFGANQDESIHAVHNGDINGNYSLIEFADCAGGVAGLYHMSGNVAEWEDSCDGATPDSKCRVRGGSFFAEGDAGTLSCKGLRTVQRVPPDTGNPDTDPLRDIGFRCCLY
jgi:hypothetical protein